MSDYPYVLASLFVLLIFPLGYLSMPRLKNRQNRIFVHLLIFQILIPPLDFAAGWAEAYAATWATPARAAYSALTLLGACWSSCSR